VNAPIPQPPLPSMASPDLPRVLREHVAAVAEALQVPADLALLLDLGAAAVAAQGIAVVRVGPDWAEPLALFTMTVLGSGERKSPAVREAARPVEEFEADLVREARVEVMQQAARHDALLKRQEKAKARAAAATDSAERASAEADLDTIAAEVASSSPGVLPRLLADDATPEALVGLLAAHGRIGVVSAEGGLFDTLAGRYSDQVANLDALLKAHGGEPIRVDRRGRESEYVEHPLASLALAVQPEVLRGVLRNRAMVGRGLLARFLVAAPESLLGRRAMHPPPVPAAVREAWRGALVGLLRQPRTTRTTPEAGGIARFARQEFTLSDDAGREFLRLRRDVERGLAPGEVFSGIPEFAGKAPGLAARVAGILHLLEVGPDAPAEVGGRTMRAACHIVRVHLEHARRITTSDPVEVQHARAVVTWADDRDSPEFSEREALTGARNRAAGPQSSDEVKAALHYLQSVGRAEQRPERDRGPQGGRPPSPRWRLVDAAPLQQAPGERAAEDAALDAARDADREQRGDEA
jgi:replicative DNA helicase